jgi:cytochrome c553
MLADGSALTGLRIDGVRVAGAKAACINCHRASGMGGAEGSMLIPPVAGSILAAPGEQRIGHKPRTSASLSRIRYPSLTRPAYTAASFEQALVAGKRPSGEEMGYLMPRYQLDEASLKQLRAYLDTLKVGQAPGVDDQALHLATIVTEDAPAAARAATLDIISRCLDERGPQQGSTLRPWRHHVWKLGADPAQWQRELARYQQEQPVFAIISGISKDSWTPIHEYCEREGMPCIFPNTAAVDADQASHWSFYFSQGVSLEAAVLAQYLADTLPPGGWRRIVQRVGASESARIGAAALERRLREQGVAIEIKTLAHDAGEEEGASDALGGKDILMLWLSPAELREFSSTAMPPDAGKIVVSGELGGLDSAPLARAWRQHAWMLYPYEPEDRHAGRIVLNAGNWMGRQGLAPQSGLLRTQGNTYSACEMTTRALQLMRSRYSREYFLELIEASDEAALATAYPRFTLGPNQRQGSRGAYLMHYRAPDFTHLVPASEWIVPSQ